MATPVMMPRQGQSVESCIIAKWHKKVGDKVAVGEVIFTYETDKATFDEEAKQDGTMLAIFFEEGDDVPCLTNVCVIGNEGEGTQEFSPSDSTQDAQETAPAAKEEAAPVAAEAVVLKEVDLNAELKISPRAKNLAQKQGLDSRYAQPTGPNGRVIERDIRALADSGVMITTAASAAYVSGNAVEGTGIGGRITIADTVAAPEAVNIVAQVAEVEEVKHPNIRKVIAKSMHQSLSTMAQLTLNSSFDATEILAFREKLKSSKDKHAIENITLNDIILYAVSKTLSAHRDCNAHYYDDKMVYFKNVNLGIAVDTPRGLMVPTLFNSNLKSLNQISGEVKALVDNCQKGTISPDALKGGTFTVTNLGSLGIETFTPVINPPQTCILGVNTLEVKVKEVKGEFKYYKSMSLSLTFDHRALDGAPAAKFLKDLCNSLENFSVLLVK